MTKRFTIFPHVIDLKEPFTPIKDNGKPITVERACDELNRLYEENKKLRMSPRVEVNEIESLVCENQRLKNFENKVWNAILSTNKRDLTDVERIFFNNLLKEMEID